MSNLLKLTLGDWSRDGHGYMEKFFIESNYNVHEVRQAYKNSCKKTGITFDGEDNYTGCNLDREPWRIPLTGYWENTIEDKAVTELRRFGLLDRSFSTGDLVDCEFAADLIMKFISLSMPEDFHYEFVESVDPAEPINGWWNSELNDTFCYGLF